MSVTPIRRQLAVVTSPLAELIGANITLDMRASEAWTILDALEDRTPLISANRAELADLLRKALTTRSLT